jgi:hypothetical protein
LVTGEQSVLSLQSSQVWGTVWLLWMYEGNSKSKVPYFLFK